MVSKALALLVLISMGLGACALPASAPTVAELELVRPVSLTRHDRNVEQVGFILVDVSASVVPLLERQRQQSWPTSFNSLRYTPSLALRPGDVISISVYETGGPSLFAAPLATAPTSSTANSSPSAQSGVQPVGSSTTIPPQTIERNGRVSVPFVGPVVVAGLTPQMAGGAIASALGSVALRPQVVVSLVSNSTNAASVAGEANRPGLIPLSLRGERILDAIAYAGGTRYPTTEIDVRLIRGSSQATVSLAQILANPQQNVVLRPNDYVMLIRNPRSFVVMGASMKVSQYTFDTTSVSVAEAIARAGGIVDTVGDPHGIYLLRTEPEEIARAVVEASAGAAINPMTKRSVPASAIGAPTRVLYKLNMALADGYFKAQRFAVQDKDVILVSNSEDTQLLKALAIARGVTGVAFDVGTALKK